MARPIDNSILTKVIEYLVKNDKEANESNVCEALASMKFSKEQKDQELCKMICEEAKRPVECVKRFKEGLDSVN